MLLSHESIQRAIDEGSIIIKPEFNKKNLRPVGLRLHLAKEILIPLPGQTVEIDKPQDLKYKEVDLTREEFYLEPGQFILDATHESLQTAPHILPILDGRSTIARLGITTHITASIIDGAFEEPHVVVLEIKNVGNFRIRLKFKDPIAMMVFALLQDPVTQKMQSQYGKNQTKVTPPNLNFRAGKDQ
jgi:dCTP deaminase